MSVSVVPAATAFTRMAQAATSLASPTVNVSKPAFAAPYGMYSFGAPVAAAIEEMLRSAAPQGRQPIRRTASLHAYKGPSKLTSTTRRTSLLDAATNGAMVPVTPALFTSAVTRPEEFATSKTTASPPGPSRLREPPGPSLFGVAGHQSTGSLAILAIGEADRVAVGDCSVDNGGADTAWTARHHDDLPLPCHVAASNALCRADGRSTVMLRISERRRRD